MINNSSILRVNSDTVLTINNKTVEVDTTLNTVTLTIPLVTNDTYELNVIDIVGNASVNNIIIAVQTPYSINGLNSISITENYANATITFDGAGNYAAVIHSSGGGGGTVTGAQNGLNLNGTNVELGGLLTQNTTIDGASIYDLDITNTQSFRADSLNTIRFTSSDYLNYQTVHRLTNDQQYLFSKDLNNLNITETTIIPDSATITSTLGVDNNIYAGLSVANTLVNINCNNLNSNLSGQINVFSGGVTIDVSDGTNNGNITVDNNNIYISGGFCSSVDTNRVAGTTDNRYNTYFVNTTVGPVVAITISAVSLFPGRVLTFKDKSGLAGTNNIIINSASGDIDGAGTYSIGTNYGAVTMQFDGTDWFILSEKV